MRWALGLTCLHANTTAAPRGACFRGSDKFDATDANRSCRFNRCSARSITIVSRSPLCAATVIYSERNEFSFKLRVNAATFSVNCRIARNRTIGRGCRDSAAVSLRLRLRHHSRRRRVPELQLRYPDVVEVTIGDKTQIGPGVQILTADHPRDAAGRASGLGDMPEAAAESVTEILKAGAIGINIEDGLFGGKRQLVSPDRHAAKIKAVRDTAEKLGIHLFINARTDPFLLKFGSPDECLNEAAKRAKAYADAGADGIFVPGLNNLALIEKFVQLTPLPVNIMVTQGVPEIPDLARAGVRRVSLGPWPMMAAMRVIGQAAAAVAASKQYGTFLQPKA
jgi:phosphoenolpyruvate phosphomutase-like protein